MLEFDGGLGILPTHHTGFQKRREIGVVNHDATVFSWLTAKAVMAQKAIGAPLINETVGHSDFLGRLVHWHFHGQFTENASSSFPVGVPLQCVGYVVEVIL